MPWESCVGCRGHLCETARSQALQSERERESVKADSLARTTHHKRNSTLPPELAYNHLDQQTSQATSIGIADWKIHWKPHFLFQGFCWAMATVCMGTAWLVHQRALQVVALLGALENWRGNHWRALTTSSWRLMLPAMAACTSTWTILNTKLLQKIEVEEEFCCVGLLFVGFFLQWTGYIVIPFSWQKEVVLRSSDSQGVGHLPIIVARYFQASCESTNFNTDFELYFSHSIKFYGCGQCTLHGARSHLLMEYHEPMNPGAWWLPYSCSRVQIQ